MKLHRLVLVLCVAPLLAAVGPCANRADEPGAGPASKERRVALGADLYARYCVACHGRFGDGNGAIADSLDVRPADLTAIRARNGTFDPSVVAGFIDGRTRVEGHWSEEMPVWGRRYDDRNAAMAEETRLAPGSILLLVEYLESIQGP